MTQLTLWMIMAYGISNIIVYSKIFSGVRNLFSEMAVTPAPMIQPIGKFLQGMTSCMMCTGTHCGWFLSLLVYSPVHEILGLTQYASWFFDAFLASGGVWAINSIIEWFEQNRPNNNQTQ